MIYWRHDQPGMPAWLMDAANVQTMFAGGRHVWWMGKSTAQPPQGLQWVDTDDGWQAAIHRQDDGGKHGDLALLLRPEKWVVVAEIEDADKKLWDIPALLDPDGHATLSQKVIIVAGKLERRPIHERHELAIDAARQARANIDALHEIDLEEVAGWACAIICAAYYIDTATILALGLLDDRLIFNALHMAAGKVEINAD
jgi:hypothetical protein